MCTRTRMSLHVCCELLCCACASACAVQVQVQIWVLILYVEPLPVLVTFDVSQGSQVLWIRYWAHPWGCYNMQVLYEVQVFVQVFFICMLQHLLRCVYATIFMYIVIPLYPWFFEINKLWFFFFFSPFFFWPPLTEILVYVRVYISIVQGESAFKWLPLVQPLHVEYYQDSDFRWV